MLLRRSISALKDLYNKNTCKVFSRNAISITNAEVRQERNYLFNKECERQKGLVTRIEKINVKYIGIPENVTLVMNKHESTPYSCALHMNETIAKRSVLAEVNGELWDVHRPLEEDCVLKFLTFLDDDPYHVNKAFWRSCSFLMGMIIENAFKDEFYIELHSWPKPDVYSGSFIYDVDLKIQDWKPTEEEIRSLTTMMQKLSLEDLKFERLVVDSSVALKIFEQNRFKKAQIPVIAESSNNLITLYRNGEHIDISIGPMISNTSHLGRSAIASVHRIVSDGCPLYRFQGVATPHQLKLNFYAFRLLIERAQTLNSNNLSLETVERAVS